jgi:hemoglobin
MKDIQNRADIQQLVDTFYKQAIHDEMIGYFFTEVVQLNFEKHMPIMYDFWETTLLGNIVYHGNPMIKHLALAEKSPMKAEHFDRWLSLWAQTVSSMFKGEVAKEAVNRATQIARLMQFKIAQQNS